MTNSIRTGLTLAALLWVPLSVQPGAALDSRPDATPFSLSVVVNGTEPGIAAVCEQGCAWERVGATYPNGEYRITEQGIHPVHGDPRSAPDLAEPAGFSVILTTNGQGVSATCETGCAWKTVSATYPTSTYRITELGIEPATQRAG